MYEYYCKIYTCQTYTFEDLDLDDIFKSNIRGVTPHW